MCRKIEISYNYLEYFSTIDWYYYSAQNGINNGNTKIKSYIKKKINNDLLNTNFFINDVL